ncbi:hypothetical protein JQK88_16365 [Mesorhizobium caraganae]|nr:hypothetical protein [Mesorhizobium caraganae]MBM2712787.1 hypothetical protein [Mesorhizobium caraganae]
MTVAAFPARSRLIDPEDEGCERDLAAGQILDHCRSSLVIIGLACTHLY